MKAKIFKDYKKLLNSCNIGLSTVMLKISLQNLNLTILKKIRFQKIKNSDLKNLKTEKDLKIFHSKNIKENVNYFNFQVIIGTKGINSAKKSGNLRRITVKIISGFKLPAAACSK